MGRSSRSEKRLRRFIQRHATPFQWFCFNALLPLLGVRTIFREALRGNFAAPFHLIRAYLRNVGNLDAPGVRTIVERIKSQLGPVISPERLVDGCLDQMGAISISQESRNILIQFASEQGDLAVDSPGANGQADRRVTDTMQVIAATHEFQRA